MTRRVRWPALPPRGLRPKLRRSQLVDLALVHLSNLDAIARGAGTEALLWQVAAGALTWSRVAQALGQGEAEMQQQLELVSTLVARYGQTGRVLFRGPEYQVAKLGVDIMDALAKIVDRPTAVAAAEWSEHHVNRMAADCVRLEGVAA